MKERDLLLIETDGGRERDRDGHDKNDENNTWKWDKGEYTPPEPYPAIQPPEPWPSPEPATDDPSQEGGRDEVRGA